MNVPGSGAGPVYGGNAPSSGASFAKAKTPHDIFITTGIELVGISVLAIVAGFGENIGTIIVILMVGFALGWAYNNITYLQRIVGKA